MKKKGSPKMKFMKLGTRPDTFYTEEASRTVISDVPSDLLVQINNTSYHLHKFSLLPKCGLLQRLFSDSADADNFTVELHDIPGGEDAFELCAKFCYGITINISAHNFVPAFCAAKFLRMTEAVDKGNFVVKLEAFFQSCILVGWKDSIVALVTTVKLPDWSENLGIIRNCIDSVVEKILTPPTKVTWSYTYTRPGYSRKDHHNVPKDWWTEDLSDLDIDLFRCIVTAVRSTYQLPPQLIGEALHVYARRWLPETVKAKLAETSVSQTDDAIEKSRRILETILSMIPSDKGSVTVGFLLRLLTTANYLGASSVMKSELIRRSSMQLEEATVGDLLFPSQVASNEQVYDIDSVVAVLESYLGQWRRQAPAIPESSLRSIRKVGKLIDSYLQVVAKDANMAVSKFTYLAEALPEIARPDHDDLYRAIDIFLKDHPDLTKSDKKSLCRILDCRKLSREARAHAVNNERLPLRTVVQLLYFEQERGSMSTSHVLAGQLSSPRGKQPLSMAGDILGKLKLGPDDASSRKEGTTKTATLSEASEKNHHHRMKTTGTKFPVELVRKVGKAEIEELGSEKVREVSEGAMAESKLDPEKMIQRGSRKDLGRDKSRNR